MYQTTTQTKPNPTRLTHNPLPQAPAQRTLPEWKVKSNVLLREELRELTAELYALIRLVEQDVELATLQHELLLLMGRYEFNQANVELNRQVAALLAALLIAGANLNNLTPNTGLSGLNKTNPALNKTTNLVADINKSRFIKQEALNHLGIINNSDLLNKPIQSERDLHYYFANPDSIGNKAVCVAEGNCRLTDGAHTENWKRHPDPGDGKINMGFCSIAPGREDNFTGSTPEQADEACVRYILKKVDFVFAEFKAAGVTPTLEKLLNALDLFNQAAPVHSSLLPKELALAEQQGLSGFKAIAYARAKTFWINNKFTAGGLWRACLARTNWRGDKWDCVYSDQLRRVEAMNSFLNKIGQASLIKKTEQLNKRLVSSEYNAQQIIKFMQGRGYEIGTKPGETNYVFIRTQQRASNQWLDRALVIQFINNQPVIVYDEPATTMPGFKYIFNGRTDGAPFLEAKQYKVHQLGIHQGMTGAFPHKALIQTGDAIQVFRDTNKSKLGGDASRDKKEYGYFGINFHATRNTGRNVNKSSAGCLVIKGPHSRFKPLVELAASDPRYLNNNKFVFPITIINKWELS